MLIAAGANLESKDKDGNTALIDAAYKKKVFLVELFLTAGADLEVTGTYSATALLWAVINGAADCMFVLLKAGANTEATFKDGRTVEELVPENNKEIEEGLKSAKARDKSAAPRLFLMEAAVARREGAGVPAALPGGACLK